MGTLHYRRLFGSLFLSATLTDTCYALRTYKYVLNGRMEMKMEIEASHLAKPRGSYPQKQTLCLLMARSAQNLFDALSQEWKMFK